MPLLPYSLTFTCVAAGPVPYTLLLTLGLAAGSGPYSLTIVRGQVPTPVGIKISHNINGSIG